MTIIKIIIPDEQTDRVINALSYYFQYKDTILDDKDVPIPNPETRHDFVLRSLQEWVTHITRDSDTNLAMAQYEDTKRLETEAARNQAIASSQTITMTVSE